MPVQLIFTEISTALRDRQIAFSGDRLMADIKFFASKSPHIINVVANTLCGYCDDVFGADQLNLLIENLAYNINRKRLGF